MKQGAMLHAKQINYGQSEIWLEGDGEELTARRTIATNEVFNVTRRHCAPELFQVFYSDFHVAVDHIAMLNVPNLDEVAVELGIKA